MHSIGKAILFKAWFLTGLIFISLHTYWFCSSIVFGTVN